MDTTKFFPAQTGHLYFLASLSTVEQQSVIISTQKTVSLNTQRALLCSKPA